VDEFRELINDYAAKMFRYMPSGEMKIDFKINPESINLDTYYSVERFAPFGMSNPKPLFGIYKAQILSISPIGGNKHIKITLAKNKTTFSVVYFGYSTTSVPFKKGDIVDLAVSIEKNEYYGKTQVSLFLKGIRYTGFNDEKIIGGLRIYENFMRNETNKEEIRFLHTDRENIAQIYRYLRDHNGWKFSAEELYMSIQPVRMNYAQMRVSLEIMYELGLLIHDTDRDRIDLPMQVSKVNIPDSKIFQKIDRLSNNQ
ncbi:MAG: hypothetical protein IJG23_01510, partial [Clostridia bacterium]|nr:hypothetical protein [Clostridia bacterium]